MAVRIEDNDTPEIQMTPLIDCVFLLIIFFLVSSQMKKVEKELPVRLPEAHATVAVKATPDLVTIGIDAFGRVYLGSEPVGNEGLRARLRAAAADSPGRRVRICGDVEAPFRSIVHVLDVCQAEGVRIVGINTRVMPRNNY